MKGRVNFPVQCTPPPSDLSTYKVPNGYLKCFSEILGQKGETDGQAAGEKIVK